MSSETTNSIGATAPFAGLSNLFARLRKFASVLYVSLQTAQMAAALNRLSDTQLNEIGVSRREIFTYAEKLVAGEHADT